MPKVSVIVPIYGVEKFIERCAVSLFEQTLSDIEFIFVNDCTKDNSMSILDTVIKRYPERQSTVKIVNHSQNKGLPTARQTGVKYASGDYICHCDSDDWVTKDAYEKMYLSAKKYQADMVISNFYISDGITDRICYNELESSERNNLFKYINIWTRMVRKDLYSKQILYPRFNMFEDRVLSLQLTVYATKVICLNEPLYYYYSNPSSICRVFKEENCLNRWKQAVENSNIIISFLQTHNLIDNYTSDILRLKYEARHQLAPITSKKEYYKLWRECYPEIDFDFLISSKIKISEKIRFILTYLKLFHLLRRVS